MAHVTLAQLTTTDTALIGTGATALIAFLGWVGVVRARRRERRTRLTEMSHQFLVAVGTYRGTVAAHLQVWESRHSRWQIAMVAAAEVVEGYARFRHPAAGLGGAARAVMGWSQAGDVTLAQALPGPAAQMSAAWLPLSSCNDKRLAAAATVLIEAALAFRGARQQERSLTKAMDAFGVQMRRVSGMGRRRWLFWRRK